MRVPVAGGNLLGPRPEVPGRGVLQWVGGRAGQDQRAWRIVRQVPGRLEGGVACVQEQVARRAEGVWGDAGPPRARCAGENDLDGKTP